jgi:hypothetical protein
MVKQTKTMNTHFSSRSPHLLSCFLLFLPVAVVAAGDSLFESKPVRLSSGINTHDVALGDLDGDGDIDAWLPNGGGVPNYNQIWLNNSEDSSESSSFTATDQRLGDSISESAALADVDDDGDLDAWISNSGWASAEPNQVYLNDGQGKFNNSNQRLGRSKSVGVKLGDLDGDGDLDAFVTNRKPKPNKVYINDGSGDFTGERSRNLTMPLCSDLLIFQAS